MGEHPLLQSVQWDVSGTTNRKDSRLWAKTANLRIWAFVPDSLKNQIDGVLTMGFESYIPKPIVRCSSKDDGSGPSGLKVCTA